MQTRDDVTWRTPDWTCDRHTYGSGRAVDLGQWIVFEIQTWLATSVGRFIARQNDSPLIGRNRLVYLFRRSVTPFERWTD